MTDTRRKHIRNRKHNNKVRRYCRWKKITVDEYYGQFLFDLRDALNQFIEAFSSFVTSMAEIAKNIQEIKKKKEVSDGMGGD